MSKNGLSPKQHRFPSYIKKGLNFMASSSGRLPNGTITRLYGVAKHEKAKQPWSLKEALKFAFRKYDMSKWRKVNSVACGIDPSMIPLPSRIVLKVLRDKGHQCYLVGGCVRDLLLKRVPKDFDVITTANLKQIKNHFHRSVIVGQRFPVCIVNIRGQAIEVSSFDTVANDGSMDESSPRLMPKCCTKTDVLLWRNSMHRDFTVNSLFFDPYSARIYDYTGGMIDLKSLELRTLIPADLSFQEDCARILRGLRIAARLNLSVSNDTASAIHRLSSSVLTLAKSRIMLELNYMLSYGAAQPSLSLLEQFNLLQYFFPCHAAILDQQIYKGYSLNSTMLMKLFSNLDNMVACDRPGHCSLWISLMAFHLALNTKPQEPLVIWTFSLLLCTKNWSRSVEFARESAQGQLLSAPEISKSFGYMEDKELANKVSELASLVATSIDSLTREATLHKSISRFKGAPSSVLVFISEKCGRETARLFSMFDADITSYTTGRKRGDIDYQALKKGEALETRFVLGQIIMDTMRGKVNETCSNHNQGTVRDDKAYKWGLVDTNLHPNPSVHATEKAANATEKFNELLRPIHRILERVEIVNLKTSPQDLDAYFLEELGPASLLEKSEEPVKVTMTYLEEDIVNQKLSEIQDNGTKHLSRQKAHNPHLEMAAKENVQQKAVNVKQVIEKLQLQTEIKFSDDSLKKVNPTTSEMFESRQEIPSKEKGETEHTVNEANGRKPLSSLFKSTMHNTSKKIEELFYGSPHQRPSDQIKDVKGTSEIVRKNMHASISEALEHLSSTSSDEELLNVGRTCQIKTTQRQVVSEKIKDETESLISILGGKYQKQSKKQGLFDTLSQAIRYKFRDEKNHGHEDYTDKIKDAIDGDNHLPSGRVSDKKTMTVKKKLVKISTKSQEKTKIGFTIANMETPEPLIVVNETQELHVDTRFLKIEDVTETLEADQQKTTFEPKHPNNLEPGKKTKTDRRALWKSENVVNSSDVIKEAFNEEKTRAHTGNGKEVEERPDGNLHHQKPAIKKRKTSLRQSSELGNEIKAGVRVKNNEAPDQDVDADIMEALGEIRFEKSVKNKKETDKTDVTTVASKPKKRRKAAQKQEKIDISTEEINEISLNERTGEVVYGNGEIQEQTTTNKKRKRRKTRRVLDQDVDADIMEALGEIRVEKSVINKKETAKTEVSKIASKPKKCHTAAQKQERIDISPEEINKIALNERAGERIHENLEILEQTTAKKKRKPRKTRSKSKPKDEVKPSTDEALQLKTAIEFTDDHLHAR